MQDNLILKFYYKLDFTMLTEYMKCLLYPLPTRITVTTLDITRPLGTNDACVKRKRGGYQWRDQPHDTWVLYILDKESKHSSSNEPTNLHREHLVVRWGLAVWTCMCKHTAIRSQQNPWHRRWGHQSDMLPVQKINIISFQA